MTGLYVRMSLAANSTMVGVEGGLYLYDSDDEWTKINSVFLLVENKIITCAIKK